MTDEAQTPPTPDLTPQKLPESGASVHEQLKRLGVGFKKANAKIASLTKERDDAVDELFKLKAAVAEAHEPDELLVQQRDEARADLEELKAAITEAAESPEATTTDPAAATDEGDKDPLMQ